MKFSDEEDIESYVILLAFSFLYLAAAAATERYLSL